MPKKSILTARAISLRLVEARTVRTLRSNEKRKIRMRRESGAALQSRFVSDIGNSPKIQGVVYVDLRVPETMDLMHNFTETAEFLRDIRRVALSQRKPVRLVFDVSKQIEPAALLVLLSHIHRCRLIFGSHHVTGTYPSDPKIERKLHATGFFKILGVRSRVKPRKQTYPLEYIGFVSEVRTTQGTARKLRDSLFGEAISLSDQARRQLTRAINEAMLNAGQHAYPANSAKHNPERGRWWLVGHVNKRSGKLTVLFCDLGVGIPQTLPKRYPMEVILATLAYLPGMRPNDGEMIQAGMTIGRTRTMLENRGKGLNDLRRFVDEAGEGELHIFSRKGHYLYEAGGHEKLRNINHSIGGTLIQWTVPLAKVSNWSIEVGSEEDETD